MRIPLQSALLAGAVTFTIPASAQATLDAVEPEQGTPALESADGEEGEEEIVVQGTRVRRRVQDEPIRVEVLAREEIEEKAIMRPGNIAMLLSETGGLRVQTTSPALGAANIACRGSTGATRSFSPTVCHSTGARRLHSGCSRFRQPTLARSR